MMAVTKRMHTGSSSATRTRPKPGPRFGDSSSFPDADSQTTSRDTGTRSCVLSSFDIISPTAHVLALQEGRKWRTPCSQPPSALCCEGTAHARQLHLQSVEERHNTA